MEIVFCVRVCSDCVLGRIKILRQKMQILVKG